MKKLILFFAMLFCCLHIFSQEREIKGQVYDSGGLEIPGVGVSIKGSKRGTITDIDGKYSISASPNDILIFSFIGYKTTERTVGKDRNIKIILEESTTELDEMVVVGYGEMKKRDLTGSISSVQAKDIERMPVSSAAEAITGKLAGVQVTTTEGAPGAEIKIRVRGGGSITQDNSPLYIIDGFPSDMGLSGIDPNDIQSIDVLKDASSTSIYGSRGSNGVVIVTTKSGKEGFNVNYNGYVGFRKIAKTLDVDDPVTFVKSQWERQIRGGGANPYMDDIINRYGQWNEIESLYNSKKSINWQDEIFGRTAMVQSHNISATGGTKNIKYNFSYSRNDEEGIMLKSGFERNYYKFKFDQKINDKFSYYLSISYTDDETEGAGTTEATETVSSLINILQYRPVAAKNGGIDDLWSEDEDPNSDDSYNYNPVKMANSLERIKATKSLQLNAGINYRINKFLTLKLSGGTFDNTTETTNLYGKYTYYARTNNGISATVDTRTQKKWNTSNTLTYRLKNKQHDITALLGQEANKRTYKSRFLTANGFQNDDIVLDNLGQAEVQAIASDAYAESLLSFFGRINYSYNSRYLFSASLRADGSSKFSKENRYGYFPAVSGAWRINEESFFMPLSDIFSNLKLRYSYGSSGNNRIDNYLYSTSYTPVYYNSNNKPIMGIKPTSLANPDLKWETTYTNNLGLDIGFFNNRISLAFEAYINKTNDLLLNAKINPVSGYTTQMLNIGKTENRGFEFTLNANLVNKSDFTIDANFNISFNKNKILALNRGENWTQNYYVETSRWGYMSGDYLVKVGEPIGLMYGFVSNGIYTADDFKDDAFTTGQFTPANLKDDVPYAVTQAKETNLLGQRKVKRFSNAVDESGHPMASADLDKVVIGDANPDFFGGFGTNITYKGFDFSVFLNFVYGNDVYNATKVRGETQVYRNQNGLSVDGQRYSMVDPVDGTIVLDRVRLNELNKNASAPAIPTIAQTLTNDAIEDGSFLRINNISIGYTLPHKLVRKIGAQKLRVYVTAYNLYTFTKYSGYDPEVDSRYSTPVTPGLDYSAYPRSRQYIMGVNLTF